MTALVACIRRAGKALNAGDADLIHEIVREYREDGMTHAEAADRAIGDVIDILNSERADLIEQLTKAGGDASPYLGGARLSRREQERQDTHRQARQETTERETAAETAATDLRSREAERLRTPNVRYGLTPDEQDSVKNNPRDPEAVAVKERMTMEEMARVPKRATRPSTLRELGNAALESNATDRTKIAGRQATLMASPTRHLADFVQGSLRTAAQRVNQLNERMTGRESALTNTAQKVIKPWMTLHQKDPKTAEILTGIMHRSTLMGVDPSKDFQPTQGADSAIEAARQSNHKRLKDLYDKQSPAAKAIYRNTRDLFAQQYQQLQTSMQQRIDAIGADKKTKQALRAMVEKTFESGRVQPYFPLSRYGDYWAVAKDDNGNVVAYSQFEKRTEQRQWLANLEAEGHTVSGGRDTRAGNRGEGPSQTVMDPDFTLDVVRGLKGLESAQATEVNNLIDDIWQTYLRSLPEMSARKQFLHRKGIAGFSGDGLRSVADASLRNARRIAKVEYQFQIENELDNLQAAAKDSADEWAMPVHDEYRQRHQWYMNHTSSPTATVMTSMGFHAYLGLLRPSAAIVNLTQTAVVGLPTLSAFAQGKPGSASVELTKAARDVGSLLKFGADPYGDPNSNKRFSADDRKALTDIEAKFALFDKTRTFDLLGLQEAGGKHVTHPMHRWAEASGWLFHNAEVYNRKVTALAGYRLARQQNQSHDDAVYQAVQLTKDTHFDYSVQNRPRFMQKDAARVAFQFRNHSVNLHYFLIRNFHDSIAKQGTPEQRKQAARRFYGTMGMQATLAGVGGMPIVWTVIEAFEALWELLDNDEQEELHELADPKTRLRGWIEDGLGEQWGTEAAALIMDGGLDGIPFAARQAFPDQAGAIPNPAFSSRLALTNVAFQDAPEDAPIGTGDWYAHYASEIAGPSVGYLMDITKGSYDLAAGDTRALERILPATPTDLLKTVRYAWDGVRNNAGATVVDNEDLAASDYASQLLGFTPYTVHRQYAENRARNFVNQRLEWRRERLSDAYKFDNKHGHDTDESLAAIEAFNQQYPAYLIDIGGLNRSAARAENRFLNGVRVQSRARQELLRQLDTTGDDQ